MKKLFGFASILFFSLALSSFSGFIKANNGQGNVITIEDGSYVWRADNCISPFIPALSSRVQKSTDGFFSVDATFQLPEGHCDIPAKGATVTHYDSNSWAIINSNGFVRAKIIVKPNAN